MRRDSDAGGASGARTTQTYILGIGASGALLAGAGVALISLVGLVSFDVWPGTPPHVGPPEEAQLNFGGGTTPEPEDGTPLSEAAGLLASASPVDGGAHTGDPGGPGKKPAPDGDGKAPPAAPVPTTPPFVPAPVEGDSRSGSQGPGKGPTIKLLPKGGKPRVEPSDNPPELDPLPVPPKVLPGRPKPGTGREDSGSTPSKGSTRGQGTPATTPAPSTSSQGVIGQTGTGNGSRRGRRG